MLYVLSAVIAFGLGVYTGLSIPKIKSWFQSKETKISTVISTAASTVVSDVTSATKKL